MNCERERHSVMAGKHTKRAALWVLALALVASSCKTTTEDNDTTNSFIRILSMEASAGEDGAGAEAVTDLFSDVCFANTMQPACSVFNDNGVVTMTGQPKNLQALSTIVNDVVFERYRVTYIRSDGRNVPGVDVPYPFDGVANFRVPVDGSTVERGFVVVRHTAKRESPLRELSGGGGPLLHVIAQVDFYGRDISGREMVVTGFLNIIFGDFSNEETG